MAPKFKDGDIAFTISGKWVSWGHTIVAYSAFLGALIVGLWLHYYKIVENEYYVGSLREIQEKIHAENLKGYPQEWFPSVSATIGDRYPERSVFQFFIAITSGTISLNAQNAHYAEPFIKVLVSPSYFCGISSLHDQDRFCQNLWLVLGYFEPSLVVDGLM